MASNNSDDPWDWGIDRVVQELCSDNCSWPNPDGFLQPDTFSLALALREQNVTGAVLLTSVDASAIKEDLQVKGLSHRSFVLAAIRYFKSASKKWSEKNQQQPHLSRRLSERLARSLEELQFEPPAHDLLNSDHKQSDFEIPVAKRRKLDSTDPTADQAPQFGTGHHGPQAIPNETSQGPVLDQSITSTGIQFPATQNGANIRGTSSALPDTLAKLPRRLNLALLATEPLPENVIRDRRLPSSADLVAHLLETPLDGVLSVRDQIGTEEPDLEREILAPTTVMGDIEDSQNKDSTAYGNTSKPNHIDHDAKDNSGYGSEFDLDATAVTLQLQRENSSKITPNPTGQSHDKDDSVSALGFKPSHSRGGLQRVGYLGNSTLLVDDIFYAGIEFGQDLNVEDLTQDDLTMSISQTSAKSQPGRSKYVGKMMRNFLLSKQHLTRNFQPIVEVNSKLNKENQIATQSLIEVPKIRPGTPNFSSNLLVRDMIREGQTFTAVRTYYEGDDAKSGLMGFLQTPSFTLYYSTSEGEIRARREKVVNWPELLAGKPAGGFNALSLSEMIEMRPGLDPDYLAKKWRESAEDEVLPAYGDSGSDYEEDPDFWREWEHEQGKVLPILRSNSRKTRSVLTAEEVNAAIDESITNLVAKWHERQYPQLKKTAYRIWQRSRDTNTKQNDIKKSQERIEYLSNRLASQRQEGFLRNSWSSHKEVLSKAHAMQMTVFEREDLRWKITVLEQDEAPEKPEKKVKSASNQITKAAVVDENIQIDDSDDDSEGLGDFIVSDNEDLDELDHFSVSSENDAESVITRTSASHCSPAQSSDSEEDKMDVDEPIPPVLANSAAESGQSSHDDPMLGFNEYPMAASKFSAPRKAAQAPAKYNEVVDLTVDSPGKTSDSSFGPVIDLCSPERSQEPSASPTPKRSASEIRIKPLRGPDRSPIISKSPQNLAPYIDPPVIAQHPYAFYEDLVDRERLLIRIIYKLEDNSRNSQLDLFADFTDIKLWTIMGSTIAELLADKGSVLGNGSTESFDRFTMLVQIFIMFVECKYIPWNKEPLPDALLENALRNSEKYFPPFYKIGGQMYRYFNELDRLPQPASPSSEVSSSTAVPVVSDDDSDEGPILRRPRRRIAIANASDDDILAQESPRLKRKKPIIEDAEARSLRDLNRQRLAEQEQRRKLIKDKLAKYGNSLDRGMEFYRINDAAAEGQEPIYVHDDFRRCIKPHQMSGVRFMWNQIVTTDGDQNMQGCLLAHTMGLGKTMQTICLLVAIAEAASSLNESISSQVPESLEKIRGLVLCPAGLIDNWMDEFLGWTPKDTLGDLYKINDLELHDRLDVISLWHERGGILLCSYNAFRDLVCNASTTKTYARLTEEEHTLIQEQLLDGPNIVIADEAHVMKNASSKISQAAQKFKTRSRIALTGSPLANNVAEYYAMIDWIVPNYLGSPAEFRAKYKIPIEAGLFLESTAYEKRKSRKMLEVLNEELRLKVDRAGMEALKHELPPKVEFVLSLPLTDIQRKVYSMYIKSLSVSDVQLTKDGEVTNTTLWHWIATLSLLCNHPYCFNAKIHESKDGAQSNKARLKDKLASNSDPTDQNDAAVAESLNVPLAKAGLSQRFIDEVTELFKTEDLMSIELSHKVAILCQILDAAKAVGDKTLIFSSSIPTLNYLESVCRVQGRPYQRLDGKTNILKRQAHIRAFNKGTDEVYLISTNAGGLGLNLQSANRVVVFDFKFNPIQEEQAVGRAYRIGQLKPTFVYRFVCGGTFEDNIHNKTIFKAQLASRVVDKKSPLAAASKSLGDFLYEPKDVPQKELTQFKGIDKVLDKILASDTGGVIRSIVQTDTFAVDVMEPLTVEEENEVREMIRVSELLRQKTSSGNVPIDVPTLVPTNVSTSAPAFTPTVATLSGFSAPFSAPSSTSPSTPEMLQPPSNNAAVISDQPRALDTFIAPERPQYEMSVNGGFEPLSPGEHADHNPPIMAGFTRREE